MKNEDTKGIERPGDRRAYSKPRLRRLGKLEEIGKNARGNQLEAHRGRERYPTSKLNAISASHFGSPPACAAH
jgi:hypothetical protein